MKIAEYKQMMEYLTRPGFNGGGSVRNKTVLPKKKPEEEVKKRKIKNFEKAKPALENPKEVKEMIDKPKRGLVNEPGSYSGQRIKTVKSLAEKGMGLLDGVTFAKAKKLVQDAYKLLKSKKVQKETDIPLKGATGSTDDLRYMKKTGRETKVKPGVEYTGDKKFFQLFNDFKDSFFGGQVKSAADNLNIGSATKDATRTKIKNTFKKYDEPLVSEKVTTTISPSKKTISLQEAKIKVKKGEDYFNNIELPEGVNLNEFYTVDDITNILKLNAKNRFNVSKDLNKFFKKEGLLDKDKIKIGDIAKFKLSSAIKVLNESGKRTTKQKGLGDSSSVGRNKEEKRIDPEYFRLFNALNQRGTKLQQEAGVYVGGRGSGGPMESRGHAVDLSVAKKYPKLFKNSNANKPSSIVYQDPLVNERIFQSLGFGTKPERDFKILESFVGKKVTPQIQSQLNIIKKNFENNYFNQAQTISNPQRSRQMLIKSAETYAAQQLKNGKKTAAEAREIIANAKNIDMNYLNTFLKNQKNRIQKLDIDIPKAGQTFKSENFYADMSVVNPNYVVGKMTTINPKAKTLKDLSSKEMDLYQQNVVNQYEDYLTGFYKGVKDKAGNRMYSNEDIIDMTDYLRFGTGGGKGRNAPGMLKGMEEPYVPKNPANRKNFAEGDFVTSDDTAFERFLKEGNFKQKAKTAFSEFKNMGRDAISGSGKYPNFQKALKAAALTYSPTSLTLGFPGLYEGMVPRLLKDPTDLAAQAELSFIPMATKGIETLFKNKNLQRLLSLGFKPKSIYKRALPFYAALPAVALQKIYKDRNLPIEQRSYEAGKIDRLLKEKQDYYTKGEMEEVPPPPFSRVTASSPKYDFAGGGIAKLAGKPSGPAPESGPTPQGLDFLMKRGR